MSFIVLRYKILEKNTGHWPGDSWKRPALILDRDIAHYVCGVIQGTTVIHGIQLPYPTTALSHIAHLVIAAEYKSYQTLGVQIPLDCTLEIDIAHYVIDEDYEAVKKYGIKRTTLSCMCSQLAQLQVIFAPSSISEDMFWGILAFIGILLEVFVSVFVTGRRD